MPTPLIIIAGKAGSGKDTAAEHLAKNYKAATIALADPMKRFMKRLVGFSTQTLWGSSEERNKFIPKDQLSVLTLSGFEYEAIRFCQDVFGYTPTPTTPAWIELQAWYIKFVMQAADRDGGLTARVLLQTLGTEWGRKVSPLMWIDCAVRRCRDLVQGGYTYDRERGMVDAPGHAYDYAVIIDGRFRSEVLGAIFSGGVALRVLRPTQEELKAGIAGHRSERELDTIPEHFYTDTIMNDGSLQDLFDRIDDAMAVHFGDVRE